MMRNATMLTPSRTGIAISRRQTTNRVMASLSGQGRGVEERVSGHTAMEPGQIARGGEAPFDIPQWQEDRGLHERVRDLLLSLDDWIKNQIRRREFIPLLYGPL